MTTDQLTDGSPARSGLDILIVEDEPDTVKTLSMLMRVAGHEVQVARDGFAALAMTEKRRPDVILLDIGLPKLNGIEVCRRIRQSCSGRPPFIVAVTGFTDDDHRRQAALAGIDLYLFKPVHFPELEKVLQMFQQVIKTTKQDSAEMPLQVPFGTASV